MPRDGTLEITGEISGELQDVSEVTGELQKKKDLTGGLSIPTERITPGDYEKLAHKPSINEVELNGNKTFDDLGDHTLSNIEIKAIFDRVFKGGN